WQFESFGHLEPFTTLFKFLRRRKLLDRLLAGRQLFHRIGSDASLYMEELAASIHRPIWLSAGITVWMRRDKSRYSLFGWLTWPPVAGPESQLRAKSEYLHCGRAEIYKYI